MGLREVAKRAGVSLATASAVLSESTTVRVSPERRELVLAAARDLSYSPKPRGLRQRPVIAICGDCDNPNPISPYNSEVLLGLFRGAEEAGAETMVLTSSRMAERRASYEFYLSQPFDALVAYAVPTGHIPVLSAVGRERKVVTLFAEPDSTDVASIDVDNRAAGILAANELLSRGYDAYVCVSGYEGDRAARLRQDGFEETVRRAGCELMEHIAPETGRHAWDGEYGLRAAECVCRLRSDASARRLGVYCWSDSVAAHMLRSSLLDCPRHFGILGTDGLSSAGPLLDCLGLSTVEIGVYETARRAVHLATAMLTGEPPSRHITLNLARLITRKSTTVVLE